MKKTLLAAFALLLVLLCAALRPRLSPVPVPLAPCPGGVVLIAVEGLPLFDRAGYDTYPNLRERSDTGATGLVPTRNGTIDETDFDAGLRVLLAGARSLEPGATLATVAKTAAVPFTLRRFTGANAARDADAYAATVPPEVAVLVVGITPAANALARRERVAPVILSAPQFRDTPHVLMSPSTRNRAGICPLTDIGSTVAALLGTNERVGDGRPLQTLSAPGSAQALRQTLRRDAATWGQQAREQSRMPVVPWTLAALVAVAIFAPGADLRRGARTVVITAPVCLVVVPAFAPPGASVWLVYALVVAVAGTVAIFARRVELLPRLLAIVTALVIAGDTLSGGTLLMRTPLSYSVLEAARFYGIGNEISGLFLGAAIVAVGAQPVAATILWGLTVAVVSGAPSLGADAGGLVATLAAFTVLSFRGVDTKKSGREIVLAGLAVVAAVAAFAGWDASRPPATRTHIGGAVARARVRGMESLAPMIRRKVSINAYLAVFSPWSALLGTQTVAIVLRARRRKRGEGKPAPPYLPALIAGIVSLLLLNDSGVVAGATCAVWQGADNDAGT